MTKGNDAQMKRRDDAGGKLGEVDGSAEQSGAKAAAVADAVPQAAPDGNAGSQARQYGEAVWDQPLPWVTPLDDAQHQSPEQPQPPQAEPLAEAEPAAEAESPTSQAAAVRDDDGDDAEAAHADTEPEPTAVFEWQRGAHAAPPPLRAGAVGGHAVPKWFLGAAVAVGGLLAVVGGIEGSKPHPSVAAVKEEAGPVLNPGAGANGAATPTSTPTSTPTPSSRAKSHTANPIAAVVTAARKENAPPASSSTGHAGSSEDNSATAPASQVPSNYLTLVATPTNSSDDKYSIQNVVIRISAPVTRLTVEIDIAPPDVSASNQEYSTTSECTYSSSRTGNGGLVFTWTLNAGHVLAPGKYTFGAAYFHDPGRSTAHDTYAVQATAQGASKSKTLGGHVS
jgi:hypothetical protein